MFGFVDHWMKCHLCSKSSFLFGSRLEGQKEAVITGSCHPVADLCSFTRDHGGSSVSAYRATTQATLKFVAVSNSTSSEVFTISEGKQTLQLSNFVHNQLSSNLFSSYPESAVLTVIRCCIFGNSRSSIRFPVAFVDCLAGSTNSGLTATDETSHLISPIHFVQCFLKNFQFHALAHPFLLFASAFN
jgi:hypothetical protein